uniref:Uncharacterized protein n=1 Tax=Oryza rufipogon TaxID=4529 RepID=A0A0E0P5I3_ORYRU
MKMRAAERQRTYSLGSFSLRLRVRDREKGKPRSLPSGSRTKCSRWKGEVWVCYRYQRISYATNRYQSIPIGLSSITRYLVCLVMTSLHVGYEGNGKVVGVNVIDAEERVHF